MKTRTLIKLLALAGLFSIGLWVIGVVFTSILKIWLVIAAYFLVDRLLGRL